MLTFLKLFSKINLLHLTFNQHREQQISRDRFFLTHAFLHSLITSTSERNNVSTKSAIHLQHAYRVGGNY